MAYKVLATLGFFRFHAIVGDFKAVLRRRRESAEISLFCSALPCKVSGRTAVTTSPLFLQKNRARHTCPISSFHQLSSLFLSLQISPNSVHCRWFGFLLGFAPQIATRGVFGGLRRSFARLLHGGYHLAVELLEAALGIGETILRYDAVEDGEHLRFLELDRIGRILVADPLVRIGRVLHEYIVAELQLLLGFEQSRFDLHASDGERCHDRFRKILRRVSL